MSEWLRERRRRYELMADDGDPMAPARGLIIGIVIGATMWTALILALLIFT